MRRSALLLAVLASCSSDDAATTHAVVSLADYGDRAIVSVEAPLVLDASAHIALVRDGIAKVGITIERASARVEERDGRVFHMFTLPVPAAEVATSASFAPELPGLPIERFVPGVDPEDDQTAAFWAYGRELVIVHGSDDELPARFEFVFPAHAAHFANTALLAGHDAREVHRGRHQMGALSVEALAVCGGSSLEIRLPEMPACHFEGALAVPMPILGRKPSAAPEVRISIGGTVVFEGAPPDDGTPVRMDDFQMSEVEAGTRLRIEVGGTPEQLVWIDEPLLVRARTPADGADVLLIVVDTLRADRLGVQGNEDGLTPAFDALAGRSIRFEQCWAGSSWTLPSVVTMLTSNHGGQHRAWLNANRLGEGIDTVAEVFRGAGYRTAAFTDGGFVGPSFGIDRGFHRLNARGGGVQAVVDRSREYLARAGDGPWFLLVHTYEVHAPYDPPADAKREILARHPDLLLGREAEPHHFYELADAGVPLPSEVSALLEDLYDGEVRYTDRVLGEFLDDVRERGLFDGAVIALTSDHGEEFGEHGLLGHGDTLYVEQLHVPLLVHMPAGARAGEVVTQPVSLLDLAPTLVDAAGLGARLERTSFVGRSLVGGGEPSPVFAVRNHEEVGLLSTVRRGDDVWIDGTYYHHVPRRLEGDGEYYQLRRDPAQATNAFGQLGEPEREELDGLIETLGEHYGRARVQDTGALPEARVRAQLDALGYGGGG